MLKEIKESNDRERPIVKSTILSHKALMELNHMLTLTGMVKTNNHLTLQTVFQSEALDEKVSFAQPSKTSAAFSALFPALCYATSLLALLPDQAFFVVSLVSSLVVS
jgi:hypothetical protein